MVMQLCMGQPPHHFWLLCTFDWLLYPCCLYVCYLGWVAMGRLDRVGWYMFSCPSGRGLQVLGVLCVDV
jgi:hypothetical protein